MVELKTLREISDELIDNQATILRVNEGLLRNGYLLLTAHGDGATLGPQTRRYAEYQENDSIEVDGDRFQFDFEFDPYGPSLLDSHPIYVADEFGTAGGGVEATPLEKGLRSITKVMRAQGKQTRPGLCCPYCGTPSPREGPDEAGPNTFVCEDGCGGWFDATSHQQRWAK